MSTRPLRTPTLAAALAACALGAGCSEVAGTGERGGSPAPQPPRPAARGATPPADAVGALASGLLRDLTAPWPRLQKQDGRFRSLVGGGTRYGEAMLGYVLLDVGRRTHDRRLVSSGLRALRYALPR